MKKKIDTATILADRLIEMLEKGVSPWHKTWNCGEAQFPTNWSGREYRGMNLFLLGMMGYSNPYWMTYRKCAELGGQVRKGEKGCPVMYWHRNDFAVKDKDGKPVLDEDGNPETRTAMLIRGYTVFNALQCDGLPEKFYPKPNKRNEKRHKPHVAAQELWDGYEGRPKVVNIERGQCCYYPSIDEIHIPPSERFDTIGDYWSTLFHEGCHSTGHETRLNRKFGAHFGSEPYAKEELIAEMGAQLLCQRCGITRTLENAAAYCKGWAKHIKSMPDYGRAIVCAAAQAQKAVDWITGIRKEED